MARHKHFRKRFAEKGTALDPANIRRRLRAALKRAGLPHARFHDLRHTYASLLVAQKAHPKLISESLGHSSIGVIPHFDVINPGTPRPPSGQIDQSIDVVCGSLEHRLDAPVTTVSNPARDPAAQRLPPKSVPEGHALDEPVSYNAPPTQR